MLKLGSCRVLVAACRLGKGTLFATSYGNEHDKKRSKSAALADGEDGLLYK